MRHGARADAGRSGLIGANHFMGNHGRGGGEWPEGGCFGLPEEAFGAGRGRHDGMSEKSWEIVGKSPAHFQSLHIVIE